ncbi:hypothetical protein [Tengunoibacter tsumagoiensis]|nr:hypothetical protein [Tengunoibacter tsumagoiensis]
MNKTTMTHTINITTDLTGVGLEQIAEYQRFWREVIKNLEFEADVVSTITEHMPAAEVEQ